MPQYTDLRQTIASKLANINDIRNKISHVNQTIDAYITKLDKEREVFHKELEEGLSFCKEMDIDVDLKNTKEIYPVVPAPETITKACIPVDRQTQEGDVDLKPEVNHKSVEEMQKIIEEVVHRTVDNKVVRRSKLPNSPVEVLLPPDDIDDEEGAVDHACAVVTMMQAKPIEQIKDPLDFI